MERIIKTPCLPERNVASVLISSDYPDISDVLLNKFNINTIQVQRNNLLSDDIASHPDCVFVQLNNNTAVSDRTVYTNIVNYLTIGENVFKFSLVNCSGNICSPYPEDVRLNVRVISDMILCNTKYVDKTIKDFADKYNYRLIHCNQGYVACSTVLLNNNALITDDESIYCSAQKNAIDSILINKGSVKLKGRDYGFIGGTYGMIGKNLLAFTGNLDTHSDAELIKSFLKKHSVDYIELNDGPLIDIGGIIPFSEYIY